MRVSMSVVIALMLTGRAFAQELLPELAGLAGKYKAAVESLEKQRLAEAGRASQAYLGTLEQVGKTATDKGEVKVIEAAAKERASALDGKLPPELPSDLPSLRLQGARKALLMKLDKINADAAAKKKRFDGQYLGILAALAAQAGPESALGKQVAAEREVVLAGAKADGNGGEADSGGAKEVKVARVKNVVVNGDFEKVDADGKPEGWERSEFASLMEEKGNHFVRFDGKMNADGSSKNIVCRQKIELAKNAKSVTVSARVRVTNRIGTKKPAAIVIFIDQDGKVSNCLYAASGSRNDTWMTINKSGVVPSDAFEICLQVENGKCPGPIDFDDVELSFK